MPTLNDLGTWTSLVAFPLAIGVVLDALVMRKSKIRLFESLHGVALSVARPWVSFLAGFFASMSTGVLCIYVAGFSQKISGLGGWLKALESAAPIALFLLLKILFFDPLLFWGTSRINSALKGKDPSGREFSRGARWATICLLLIGACALTRALLYLGEEVQDYGLQRLFPPTPVSVNQETGESSDNSLAKENSVHRSNITSNSTAKLHEPVIAKDKAGTPTTRPFSITDILNSFNLLIADFYSHAFLLLNGTSCFFLLLALLRLLSGVALHVDKETLPKYIFTAMSLAVSAVVTILLIGYQILANR